MDALDLLERGNPNAVQEIAAIKTVIADIDHQRKQWSRSAYRLASTGNQMQKLGLQREKWEKRLQELEI